MHFDEYINKPLNELELIHAIARIVQTNYEHFTFKSYYLHLLKGENETTVLSEVHAFDSEAEKKKFFYCYKLGSANIKINIYSNVLYLGIRGYKNLGIIDVYPDKLSFDKFYRDIPPWKTMTIDEIKLGFQELSNLCMSRKDDKLSS
jgi:hypothetical protein